MDKSNTLERIKDTILGDFGRIYYTEKDNQIISIAQTTCENMASAMIIGVATHKDYRNQGYTSSCLSKLSRDLIEEGMNPCLSYSSPLAGRVYKKLGFNPIGKWTILFNEDIS